MHLIRVYGEHGWKEAYLDPYNPC